MRQWRAHQNYDISMRQAELATFWISAGLPDNRWPEFLTWFARTAPGVLGNVNHSWHWLREFGFSLTRTLLTNAAASLHCVVPALGMPSDYVRVIDVVTINEVSLLPIIEIQIGPDGKMRYTLVGCPALGNIHTQVAAAGGEGPNKKSASASGDNLLPAIGGIVSSMFRFHSAEKLVRMVHAVENSLLLKPPDRRHRLAMTMAGGAIQGPGSVGFEEEEAKVDKRHGLPVGGGSFIVWTGQATMRIGSSPSHSCTTGFCG